MGSEGGRRAINVQAKQGTATSRPGPQQQGHGRGVEAALKAGIEPSYGTAHPPQRQEDQKAADHDVAWLALRLARRGVRTRRVGMRLSGRGNVPPFTQAWPPSSATSLSSSPSRP